MLGERKAAKRKPMTRATCLEMLEKKARNLLEFGVEMSVKITLMLKEARPSRILFERGDKKEESVWKGLSNERFAVDNQSLRGSKVIT